MSNDNAFRKLDQLVSELHRDIENLGNGALAVEQLEKMVGNTRELYERLVVIRHKVYGDMVHANEQQPSAVPQEETPVSTFETPISATEESTAPSINFRIDPAPEKSNQFNLLDAIAEATTDQSALTNTNTAANVISQHAVPESLHERLAKSVGYQESVADKLESSPISDLKKAITLNQRFQFSKELFKGNNQDYELAIEKLNNGSREDALNHIQNLKSKYTWNNESEIVADFIDLVERRHL